MAFQTATNRPIAEGMALDRGDGRSLLGTYTNSGSDDLAHELTHRLVGHYLWRAPVWLNEGLAQYYQTLELDAQTVTIDDFPRPVRRGDVFVEQLEAGLFERLIYPPVERLLRANADEFYRLGGAYYFVSAMLVHMLQDEPEDRRRLRQYISLIREGMPSAEAW